MRCGQYELNGAHNPSPDLPCIQPGPSPTIHLRALRQSTARESPLLAAHVTRYTTYQVGLRMLLDAVGQAHCRLTYLDVSGNGLSEVE